MSDEVRQRSMGMPMEDMMDGMAARTRDRVATGAGQQSSAFSQVQQKYPPQMPMQSQSSRPSPRNFQKNEEREQWSLNDIPWQQIQVSIPYVAMIGFAIYLWIVGASTTLYALSIFSVPVEKLSYAQWLIPFSISYIEYMWWPEKGQVWESAAFGAALLFDGGSSFLAVHNYVSGRNVPLFFDYTIGESGAEPVIIAAIATVILTFLPERILKHSYARLRGIWNY